MKKILSVRQETTYTGERILWNSFSQNTHKLRRIILYTLFGFRTVALVHQFSSLLANSV